LKVLLQSRIKEISHVWLYLPQWQAEADALQPVLTQLHTGEPRPPDFGRLGHARRL
jgi:hypothetical protein